MSTRADLEAAAKTINDVSFFADLARDSYLTALDEIEGYDHSVADEPLNRVRAATAVLSVRAQQLVEALDSTTLTLPVPHLGMVPIAPTIQSDAPRTITLPVPSLAMVPVVPTLSAAGGTQATGELVDNLNGGTPLDGATISTQFKPAYEPGPSESIDHVVWLMDSLIFRSNDLDAPYEMRPGSVAIGAYTTFVGADETGENNSFSTAAGEHTITAQIHYTDDSVASVVATFTVPPIVSIGSRPTDPTQVGYLGAGYQLGDLVNTYTGTYTIDGDGGTYDFLNVTGKIRINGDNNTLRFGRVVGSSATNNANGAIEITGVGNVIEDFEILGGANNNPSTPRTQNGVWCGLAAPYTLRRCRIAYVSADATKVKTSGGDTLMEECLFHERYAFSGQAHADAVQSQQGGGKLTIDSCTMLWGIPAGYDGDDVDDDVVSQGQGLWLNNESSPRAFTEIVVRNTRVLSTSMCVGLTGVSSQCQRAEWCDNEFETDRQSDGFQVIHPGVEGNFAPQTLAWSNNIDTGDGNAVIPPPNSRTPNLAC